MKNELYDVELTTNSPDDWRLDKTWGFISALPSEHLIHFRKGSIREKTSGQGASCFKMPRDTVFIIPTSLKEIVFKAHQLTADNVDVRIRGMAVYRISDPLKIYSIINFKNRESAEKKLAIMIGDMCRSTAKWLVSNMCVDECMRKRKEEIAESLKKEVSQVVANDKTGWGTEIITIYIQDVFIEDEEIFNTMQMMFKTEKMRDSELAQLDTKRNVEMKRLEVERNIAENKKQNELEKARIEAEIKNEQIRLKQQNEEKQSVLNRYKVEQDEEIANYKLAQVIERDKQKLVSHLEKAKTDAESKRLIHLEEIEHMKNKINADNSALPAGLQRDFIEKALPELAKIMSENMRDVKMNIFQTDGKGGTPFNFILMELFDILHDKMRSFSGDIINNVQQGSHKGDKNEYTTDRRSENKDEVFDEDIFDDDCE